MKNASVVFSGVYKTRGLSPRAIPKRKDPGGNIGNINKCKTDASRPIPVVPTLNPISFLYYI
jgi:hypothetical protein